MKLKKRKRSSRDRGRRTCGHSAKLHKGKGSRGGKGMSGTGKRADQKKTKVLKELYPYFGKKGFTSRKSEKKKEKTINIQDIEERFPEGEVNLEEYKILGDGEISGKFTIRARAASESAKEKIKKAGGSIIILEKNKENKKEEIKEEKKK